jgi:adenylate kinase family enzyme
MRIMIFGRPGSGKLTLATQLHKATGIPLYHLDKYFYTDHWVERNYTEFLALHQEIVNHEQWIIDGNSAKSLHMRWARANVVIFLNFPRYICYPRVFKRWFTKDTTIDDRAPNCQETIRWSLLQYMWRYDQRVAEPIRILRAQHPNAQFYEVHNNTELAELIQKLPNIILNSQTNNRT